MRQLSKIRYFSLFLILGLYSVAGTSAKEPTHSKATVWKIDTNHTKANFSINYLGIAPVKGYFTGIVGSLSIVGEDIKTAKVKVDIPVKSVDTGIRKRDDHLLRSDFFHAKAFPKMTFESKRIFQGKDGKIRMQGLLKIRDVQKNVVFILNNISKEVKNPYGTMVRGMTATTTINRMDFGVKHSGFIVGKMVEISLDIVLMKTKS